jgi:hypothetical protein
MTEMTTYRISATAERLAVPVKRSIAFAQVGSIRTARVRERAVHRCDEESRGDQQSPPVAEKRYRASRITFHLRLLCDLARVTTRFLMLDCATSTVDLDLIDDRAMQVGNATALCSAE